MDLKEIKELIAVMRRNKIKEIDLEQEGSKIRIVANDPQPKQPEVPLNLTPAVTAYYAPPPVDAHHPAAPAPAVPPAPAAPVEAAEPVPEPAPEEEESRGVEITSPMVGTFYRAASPEAPAYVEIGSVVNDDSVLCIVEAMKLMNEIKAEVRGKILKVLVENGQPVEFGQPLFLVEPF